MKLDEIKKNPTSLSKGFTDHRSCVGFHESLMRSYHILEYVKEYLRKNPVIKNTDFILNIIAYLEQDDIEK